MKPDYKFRLGIVLAIASALIVGRIYYHVYTAVRNSVTHAYSAPNF